MKQFFYLLFAIFMFACSPIEEQNTINPPTFTLKSDRLIEVASNNHVVLYVPKGSKDLYSLAYCWGDFKSIKEFEQE